MNYHIAGLLAVLLVVTHCANKPKSAWDDIDYSKVRNRQARENDAAYTPPTIANCVDDDLYNCNK